LEPEDDGLRKALLKFIGDFANWDLSSNPLYLKAAFDLIAAVGAHQMPLVVDPFAGGGSIPLEALRLGCEAFASDLNPVACLILKILIEDIPRQGPELADELLLAGAIVKKAATRSLREFYPLDPDDASPIAYIWARTVRCEAPSCGAEIPLVRSFWLCQKPKRRRALRYQVVKLKGKPPQLKFEIFEPKTKEEVPSGTVSRAKGKCPCCGTILSPARVRSLLRIQGGGANVIFDGEGNRIGGARLMAVVTLKIGEEGRLYRLPRNKDHQPILKAKRRLEEVSSRRLHNGLSPLPDEPLTLMSGTFNVPIYGMTTWGSIFTNRQLLALSTFCDAIRNLDT
jgi:adenine-specific DNA methylase